MKVIRVKRWDDYQHYKKGSRSTPPWIKLHNSTLSSRTWVMLDDASRVLAVAIMMLASRHDNRIPLDPEYIQRVAYLSCPPDFDPLVNVDFIEIIDKELKERDIDIDIDIEAIADDKHLLARASKRTKIKDSTFQTEWITEAREKEKYRRLDIEAQAEQFQLYHGSKGTLFADWKKAWWNWLNKALEFSKDKPQAGQDEKLRKIVERQERLYS